MSEKAPPFESPEEKKEETAYDKPERNPKTNAIERMKAYDEDVNEVPDAPRDPSRRKFLTRAVGGAANMAVGGSIAYGLWKNSQEDEAAPRSANEGLTPRPTEIDTETSVEKDPTGKDIAEQLEEFGEVVDMHAAVEVMYNEKYTELAETADGQKRIDDIAARFSQYNIDALAEAFKERGLESWLAVGLPAHESDWLDRTSKRGALGTHQLMPAMVAKLGERLGYKKPDPHDVYQSNEMAAEYLRDERNRFGDDIYMQLYAYVAGIKLTGFTSQEDRENWDRKHLYSFVRDRFNRTYAELKGEGFVFSEKSVHVVHTIEKGDTMWSISKKYDIDMNRICEANGIDDPNVIAAGEDIRIPYQNNLVKELRERNWNTLHMLEYAPHLIALYDALVSRGYVVARGETDDSLKVAFSE